MADDDERVEPEILGDEPTGLVAEACREGLEHAVRYVSDQRGEVIAGYTMLLVAEPLEEGAAPDAPRKAKAGMWLMVDAEDGPSDPREFLDFLLAGVQQFANSQGLPLARFEMPPNPGQG